MPTLTLKQDRRKMGKGRRWAWWPLIAIWRLVTLLATGLGILMTLLLGGVLMLVGFILTSTLIGAVVGIPLFLMGLLLFIRGLW